MLRQKYIDEKYAFVIIYGYVSKNQLFAKFQPFFNHKTNFKSQRVVGLKLPSPTTLSQRVNPGTIELIFQNLFQI